MREHKRTIAIVKISASADESEAFPVTHFKLEEKVLAIGTKPSVNLPVAGTHSFPRQEYLCVVTERTVEAMNYMYLTVS